MAVIFFDGFTRQADTNYWSWSGSSVTFPGYGAVIAPSTPASYSLKLQNIGTHSNKKLYLGFRLSTLVVRDNQPFIKVYNATGDVLLQLTWNTANVTYPDVGLNVVTTASTSATGTALSGSGVSNQLYAWGDNTFGQFGSGTTTNTATPTKIGLAANWIKVQSDYYIYSASAGAGGSGTLGLNSAGELYSWGNGISGGPYAGYADASSTPVRVGALSNWTDISARHGFALALNSSGEMYAWGDNDDGQLGNTNLPLTARAALLPTKIGSATNWTKIATGQQHAVAINSDGEMYAWGANDLNQIGDGTTTQRSTPTRVGSHKSWASVACGGTFNVAIATDGTLHAWGAGNLGNGTYAATSPTQIGSKSNWSKVTVGGTSNIGHVLALDADGQLWAWASFNDHGQVGNGTTNAVIYPTRIGDKSNWVEIAAGLEHSFAINSAGDLYGWGANDQGQLGLGLGAADVLIPTKISNAFSNIFAGYATSFGISNGTSNGLVYNADPMFKMLNSIATVGYNNPTPDRYLFSTSRLFEIELDLTNNTLAVKYNEQNLLNTSNTTTITSLGITDPVAAIAIFGSSVDADTHVDNMYLIDDSGAFANTWLGNSFQVHSPNFTGNFSSGWQGVPDNGGYQLNSADGDASYLRVGTFDNYSTCQLTDITPSGVSPGVAGLRINSVSRRANLPAAYKYAYKNPNTSTDFEMGTKITPNTMYELQPAQFISINPETSAQWTVTEINDGAFGVKSVDPS